MIRYYFSEKSIKAISYFDAKSNYNLYRSNMFPKLYLGLISLGISIVHIIKMRDLNILDTSLLIIGLILIINYTISRIKNPLHKFVKKSEESLKKAMYHAAVEAEIELLTGEDVNE